MISKLRMYKGSLTAFFFAIPLLACTTLAHASTITNNLGQTPADVDFFSGTTWGAAGFRTDNQSYILDSVSLLFSNSTQGQALVSLYADNDGSPGTLIGNLVSPASYTSDPSVVDFGGNGLSLSPDTSYWIVLQAVSGEFTWSWTESSQGSGPGFQPNWALTSDGGQDWSVFGDEPMMMGVDGTALVATPEPASIELLLTGLAGVAMGAGPPASGEEITAICPGQRYRRTFVKTLKSLFLAVVVCLLGLGTAQASQDPTLFQLAAPLLGAKVAGETVTITVSVSSKANPATFKVLLNGQNISTLFARSGHCSNGACTESATVAATNGLRPGNNMISLGVQGFDGASSFYQQSMFTSTSGLNAADDTPALLTTYAFNTLTVGGPQPNTAWFSVSSFGLNALTSTFPKNPTDCSGSTYMVVAISRIDLTEVSTQCQNAPLNLSQYSSDELVVVGTVNGKTADATLDTTPIGGTNFSKVDSTLVPAKYMAVGYGPQQNSGSGPPPPPGAALESYYIQSTENGDSSTMPQVQGLLTINGLNRFNINAADNLAFAVNAQKGVVQIGKQTYTIPNPGNAPSGFWVLELDRLTLQNIHGCKVDDDGVTYEQCGRYFGSDDTGVGNLHSYLSSLPISDQRNLMVLVAWGIQPGIQGVSAGNVKILVKDLESLGGSRYSLDDMMFSTDAYALITSTDPGFRKDFGSQQVLSSNTANVAQGQTGQLTGAIARDNHYLYRPAYANIADFTVVPYQPGDPNLAIIAWQPPVNWLMLDTPGHTLAYKYLSTALLTKAQLGDNTANDIRYYYPYLTPNAYLLSLDPTNPALFPYPGSSQGFTQQEFTDVANQLNIELREVSNVLNFFSIMHTSVIGDSGDGAAFEMIGAITQATHDVNTKEETQVSPVMSNILNSAGAIASLASVVDPESAPCSASIPGCCGFPARPESWTRIKAGFPRKT